MSDNSKINSDSHKLPPPGSQTASESQCMCSVYLNNLPGHYKGKSWGELGALNTFRHEQQHKHGVGFHLGGGRQIENERKKEMRCQVDCKGS